MDNISCTDRVINEEMLHRVKEERIILHAVKRKRGVRVVHIIRRTAF